MPREKAGRKKEEEKMLEEIDIEQTDEQQTLAARPSLQEHTSSGRTSANRKPMVSWVALLEGAVIKPGYTHEAYSCFHSYSLGNQILALFHCFERGIQPGPLATWPKWKELGCYVKKDEKALTLCMPLTCKRTKTIKKDDGTDQEEESSFTHFTYKGHWFVLSQTDGVEYQMNRPRLPRWTSSVYRSRTWTATPRVTRSVAGGSRSTQLRLSR
ncbi:MAG: hypothetical protein AUI53_06800 [Acidobacteria bacterium 13_1_40CM_2_60_7]|nr:MAG: hypothetical protein AUI53_06800 [Acidobacteria bacterium 13_1_40CM_2_60_7]